MFSRFNRIFYGKNKILPAVREFKNYPPYFYAHAVLQPDFAASFT